MVTIFTPTFNRSYCLQNLYESLVNQSNKNFEWIIVDDGSIDSTKELVAKWIVQSSSFVIRYVYQKNGGKHRAINRSVAMAQYDYCFLADSDDFLQNNAVEHIQKWIATIDNDFKYAGVSGLKGYISGGQIGGYPKKKKFQRYVDATNLERRKLNLGGDKAEIYRTEILKKYPFPEFEGENFLTEEVVWDAVARDGYIFRWFNEIIFLCDYIEDGLTRMGEKKLINNFNGYTYATRQRMELHGLLEREFAAGRYLKIAKQKGLTLKNSAKKLEISIVDIVFAYLISCAKNCVKKLIKFTRCKLKNKGNKI